MIERDYAVYVVDRGKRPRRIDLSVPAGGKLPAHIDVDGQTYFWTTADVSARTLTYAAWKPAADAVA